MVADEPGPMSSPDARVERALPWVIGLGIVVRVISWLGNRSLWLDEAMLALNIERRGFGDLIGTLDFNQAAPLGFLWLEKLATVVLGVNELALRLWPLLAGVVALLAFSAVAARLLGPGARGLALLLFAISGSLVYFSSEVKQYSFDVAMAALLLLVAVRHGAARSVTSRSGAPPGKAESGSAPAATAWLPLALAGAVGVWFSHPLVFMLPGAFLYVLWAHDDRRAIARPAALIAALWAVSFAAAFWLTARGASRNPAMAEFWTEGFLPLAPTSLEDLAWYPRALAGWIRVTVDYSDAVTPVRTIGIWAGAILALVGIGRGWRRDRRALCLVALPLLLALLAAALRLYPFRGRLLLFLVPSTLALIGWGSEAIWHWRREAGAGPAAWRIVRSAPAVALLAASSVALADWLRTPHREELRPVLERVAAAVEPGDVVYLHSGAQHAGLFYERVCEVCRLAPAQVVRGAFLAGSDEAIAAELDRMPVSGRLWAVFSHAWWGYGDLERDRLVAELTARAGEPELIAEPGAEAYLFIFAAETGPRDESGPRVDPDPRVEALVAAIRAGRSADVETTSAGLAAEAWDAGRVEAAHRFALQPAYLALYAARDVDRALTLAEGMLSRFPPDRDRPVSGLVLADFFARAGQTDRARAFADQWVRAITVEAPHAPLERLRALLDLGTGNPDAAISRLRLDESRADGCATCADFDLAVAYEAIGARDSALAAFDRFLEAAESEETTDPPGPATLGPGAWGLGYARQRVASLRSGS